MKVNSKDIAETFCPPVLPGHSDGVEAGGGGEGGGEGTRLPDSPAAPESNAHLQAGPQRLQGAG